MRPRKPEQIVEAGQTCLVDAKPSMFWIASWSGLQNDE